MLLLLGSIGTSNIPLMKRLIGILAKTPLFYIVSKGVFHEELTLAENMWGGRYVPQTKILPIVDAAIIHGKFCFVKQNILRYSLILFRRQQLAY